MSTLKGNVAVVTGAGKGIGRETALLLSRHGARVVAAARTETDINRLIEEIDSLGGAGLAVVADIQKREDADRLMAETVKRFGGIDILVNNAGVGVFADVIDLSDKEWCAQIETNLTGMFYCTRAALNVMLKSNESAIRHIVNIASLAATAGFRGGSAYCASKFGVIGFSESLMLEVREHNIKVSVILPGSVNTYFRGTEPDSDSWKLQPEDVAQAVYDVVASSAQALISRVELRPLRPKR